MGRVDGTSRDNGRPAGVADGFQVRKHSVEPVLANRCRNLLSHPDSGPSGTEQAKLVGPQMPLVVVSEAFARCAERLAGATAGPQLAIVGPAGKTSCKGPPTDPGEEMALGESGEVFWLDIDYAPSVNDARRQMPGVDQVLEPLRGVRIKLVVVVHPRSPEKARPGTPSRATTALPKQVVKTRSVFGARRLGVEVVFSA